MPLARASIQRVLIICASVAAVDQLVKAAILARFEEGELHPVIPGFFNLVLYKNPGVAFGMFSDLSDGVRQAVLAVTTLIAVSLVFFFLFKDFKNHRLGQVSLAMILGGAFGNIIDRIRLGRVVDYLDFYVGSYHWPAFNVADSAICVGVAILLFCKPESAAVSATSAHGESAAR